MRGRSFLLMCIMHACVHSLSSFTLLHMMRREKKGGKEGGEGGEEAAALDESKRKKEKKVGVHVSSLVLVPAPL